MGFLAAQTNIQLYAQIAAADYSFKEHLLVRESYDLAVRFFSIHYLADGRPLLAHLVGTASILAHSETDPAAVASGIHWLSCWPSDRLDRAGLASGADRRRKELEAVMGQPVARIVAHVGRVADSSLSRAPDWNLENSCDLQAPAILRAAALETARAAQTGIAEESVSAACGSPVRQLSGLHELSAFPARWVREGGESAPEGVRLGQAPEVNVICPRSARRRFRESIARTRVREGSP